MQIKERGPNEEHTSCAVYESSPDVGSSRKSTWGFVMRECLYLHVLPAQHLHIHEADCLLM